MSQALRWSLRSTSRIVRSSRADVILFLAAIVKVVNTRVLEKATDDADDSNVVRNARHTGTQSTRVPNDEVDMHTRLRGFVERTGDVDIFERVGLDLNEALLSFTSPADLPPDFLEECGLEDLRSG
jgi:hypothetical protein